MKESPDPAKPQQQENPLLNIMINVMLPVVALGPLSKGDHDPLTQAVGEKLWHIGPIWGMIVAVAFPLIYGIKDFIKTKKPNMFSVLGVVSVALTGGITLYTWNKDGSIKNNAAQLFAIKESAIPLIFGLAILLSHWTKTPLVKTFLYTPELFNIPRIEKRITKTNADEPYRKILLEATITLAASFFISMLANYFLAMHFLTKVDVKADNARIAYNEAVSKLTGWGFAVIGVPMMVFLMLALFRLTSGLTKITGLSRDEQMNQR